VEVSAVFRNVRLFVALGCVPLFGVVPVRAVEAGIAQLSVSVYNDADVPAETLSRAEQSASDVLRAAGVHVLWLNGDQGLNRPETGKEVRYSVPFGLSLRVVRKAATLPTVAFGVSFLGADESGRYGDIFYDTAQRLSETNHLNLPNVLGHVIAHELGHLLLGTNAHSQVGIMRPRWSRDELNGLAMGRLRFTSQQAQSMRDKLQNLTESERFSPGLSLNRVPR
jgi:hypothetical protein